MTAIINILSIGILCFFTSCQEFELVRETAKRVGSHELRIRQLDDEIYNLKQQISQHELKNGAVNLFTQGFQKTNDPQFRVLFDDVTAHLTGVKIKGKLVNMSSVDCIACKFTLTVSGHTADIMFNRVTAGEATKFKIYIPDVLKESPYSGLFLFSTGAISYR